MKTLLKLINIKKSTMSVAGVFLLYASFTYFFNSSHSGLYIGHSGTNFVLSYNRHLGAFIIHISILSFLFSACYHKISNDLVIIRYRTYGAFQVREIQLVLVLSVVYTALNMLIQLIFLAFYDRPAQLIWADVFLAFFTQLLTVAFSFLLFLLLKLLSGHIGFAIGFIIILFAFDTLTTIVHTPLIPESLNIFAAPMCLLYIYVPEIGRADFFYQISFAVFKIRAVLVLDYFVSLCRARGKKYAEKN